MNRNPALRLATQAGTAEMAIPCSLGIPDCVPHENGVHFPYNKSSIDQTHSQDGWILASIVFFFFFFFVGVFVWAFLCVQ